MSALYRTPSGKVGRVVAQSAYSDWQNERARVWLEVPLHLPNDYGRAEPALFTRIAYHPGDLTPLGQRAEVRDG